MSRRVVVTGIGLASPVGNDLDSLANALREGRHGIAARDDWAQIDLLRTRLSAEVRGIDFADYPRKSVRSVGRVGLLALYASDQAIADAGLDADLLASGELGLTYGSTHGSSSAQEDFCKKLFGESSLRGIAGSAYLKFMSHTCAANLALHYGIRGRVVPTCAACASGSVAIGTAYELIVAGVHDVCLAGGAEEAHFVPASVFDILRATSTGYDAEPGRASRPFDAGRDGLVVGEGACTLVLETLERAVARGATIHGEILAYSSNCDGTHVTSPSPEGMADAMRRALSMARLDARDVGYVNAHATATEVGDIAESAATYEVFGGGVAVSSTKGNMGHTLGACGALETAICLRALRDGELPPTKNLEVVDPRCAPLDYVVGGMRAAQIDVAMNNNFAFGGINTSLILGRAP